jgi:NAD+ synthase (glutamine-hydrolysing)
VKIALAQMRVRAAAPSQNATELQEYIEQARMQGAHLVLCPEMCLSGYLVGDAWERQGFLADIARAHSDLQAYSRSLGEHGPVVVFGSLDVVPQEKNEDGRVRKTNGAFCLHRGQFFRWHGNPLQSVGKSLSPNYREFDDSRHFFDLRKWAEAKGSSLEDFLHPLNLPRIENENPQEHAPRMGLMLCEDGWHDDYTASPPSLLKAKGVDFFANLSCSPFTFQKHSKRHRVFSSLARRHDTPLFYVNCVGIQNVGKTIYGFDGGSLVLGASGELIFEGGFFEEQLILLEFHVNSKSCKFTQAYQRNRGTSGFQHAPLPSYQRVSQMSEMEEKSSALEKITGLACAEWNIRQVVIGISGGIDSALSATLFSRVLGPENVWCVNMPSRFNSQLTQTAAENLAKNLGCSYLVAPIEASCELTLKELSQWKFQPRNAPFNVTTLVKENIQARDRSARVLSALAAALGAVFPCNANKAESTVGYSTLYGDQSGFLAPLSDLWKHDIYAMARHYNEEVFGKEIIPQATLDVVPSAELSDAQDVMLQKGDPLHYPYHDFLFRSWVERWDRWDISDCLQAYLEGKLESEIGCKAGLVTQLFATPVEFINDLERWWRNYVGLGAFKRVQAPPVVALSRRAFGFDHREHIGSVPFSKRYEELKTLALQPTESAASHEK